MGNKTPGSDWGAVPVFYTGLGLIFGLPLTSSSWSVSRSRWSIRNRVTSASRRRYHHRSVRANFALTIYTPHLSERSSARDPGDQQGQWEAAGRWPAPGSNPAHGHHTASAARHRSAPDNQYLNLTKNSSLAIAIGYMDIVATLGGITLMQVTRWKRSCS